jgi:hypothetical protein
MNRIQKSFARLSKLPCWGVKRGHGSFLTLEFGRPHLIVREPIASASGSIRMRRRLQKRHVYVAGQWHLWIYCCDWQLREGVRAIGDSSSARRVDRAARHLDGQRFVEVTIGSSGARTMFLFDGGSVLETKPYDRKSEQWFLYEPRGHVLGFRADRKYCWGSARQRERSWRAV